ncbi:MAG: TRAP transporter small permease [Alphaproteobacteria bacterium]|nr:MAG: TRAP transporter small permease [Alphaproteobacteria bacterium]
MAAGGSAGHGAGRLARTVQALLGVALLVIVAVNVVNALGRHLAGAGLVGADELMTFTMVWIVMAGAVLALAARAHIAIGLVPAMLGAGGRRLLALGHDSVALAVCLVAARASVEYVARLDALGMTSMALGVPLAPVHAALPAGYAGLALVSGWGVIAGLRGLMRSGGSGRPA